MNGPKEEHPEKVKMMAENSTKIAENLLSADYLAKQYKERFVDYFGKLMEAYHPQERSWTE
jgi:hypothetical protein